MKDPTAPDEPSVAIVQADPATEYDPYDVGDDMLALFKEATREARLRALDHDGYMTIIDGEIVTVRRAKVD